MSRRERARREAVVGAFLGATLGGGLWACFDGSPRTLLGWAILPGIFFAVVFHQNEWLGG